MEAVVRVLVTGATGFVGRRVVGELQPRHQVRVLVHTVGRERIFPDRSVEVCYGSISDRHALTEAFLDVDAVVHLVGAIRRRPGRPFDLVNRRGTASVVAAAKAAEVRHFVQVSAIGAGPDQSYPYLLSKWQGEQEVAKSGLTYTILRSSIMFGDGDEFLNVLAALVRVFPVVPVIGLGRNRFQPIAVEDVARCVALSLERASLRDRTVEIGGPDHLTYNDLVTIVAQALKKRRLRFHIPVWTAYPVVKLVQAMQPRPPVTTDQLRMMSIRNVAEPGVVQQEFGFTPRKLEGNIDYIKLADFWSALGITMGSMPKSIRDH